MVVDYGGYGDEADERIASLLKELRAEYPNARIVGHNELPGVRKACPCFSCKTEYADL